MNNQQSTAASFFRSLVGALAIVAVAGVSVMGLTVYKDLRSQELRNQAIYECGQVSQFTYEEVNQSNGRKTVSQEPNKGVYTTCVKDKGYLTSN